ncbi:MAG: bifunctional oligoribonuclease/PAP phosphatase NrnA [Eubacteriales bacterium]|nr:bifunctional oligoribonuclease/PAP phosphatase NrnA [Eubacteriales bacterium]
MKNIAEVLEGVKTVGIGGHVRPDGDCIGSNIALYLYIKKWFPDISADIYLEAPKPEFSYLEGFEEILTKPKEDVVYDLFITCDVSAKERLAIALPLWEKAKKTLCVDHHISNEGFADENVVLGEVSSASEVLYGLLEPEKIDTAIATAIYTGIVHDTGVFQYSSTSPDTMRISGELMGKGVDFNRIIDESFYQKTYLQNQIMGRVLAESMLVLDGKVIVGYLRKKDLDFYGAVGGDLDGIVSQLRLTRGVEVAMFLYELENMHFKVSLRSNGYVNVSEVAMFFGGGGHVRAAGCNLEGNVHDVINNVMEQIVKQLKTS